MIASLPTSKLTPRKKAHTHTYTYIYTHTRVEEALCMWEQHFTSRFCCFLKKNTFLCAFWTKNRTVSNTEHCLPQLWLSWCLEISTDQVQYSDGLMNLNYTFFRAEGGLWKRPVWSLAISDCSPTHIQVVWFVCWQASTKSRHWYKEKYCLPTLSKYVKW